MPLQTELIVAVLPCGYNYFAPNGAGPRSPFRPACARWRPIDCRRIVEAQSPVPGTKDMGCHGVSRPARVAGGQTFKYRQVLAHGRNHVGFIEARLFPSENPELEKVHPVD